MDEVSKILYLPGEHLSSFSNHFPEICHSYTRHRVMDMRPCKPLCLTIFPVHSKNNSHNYFVNLFVSMPYDLSNDQKFVPSNVNICISKEFRTSILNFNILTNEKKS